MNTPVDVDALVRRFAAALVRLRARPLDEAEVWRVREAYALFVGDWAVDGWTCDPGGARRAVVGTLRCGFSGDGAWLLARYQEVATAVNVRPSVATDHWGIADGELVRFGFGAAGSGFFGTATGWSAGGLVWEGAWYGAGRRVRACDVVRRDAGGLWISGFVDEEHVAELRLTRCQAG